MHCLLGENGAGKSTLIGILSGLAAARRRARSGSTGATTAIDSPRAALELGIGTVYQHSALIPALTVLENLMLGDTRRLRLDDAGARARACAELAAPLGVEVDPDARAADLALGHQQQVEIVKALWRGSRVLILDEPTSMLTPQGVAELDEGARPPEGAGPGGRSSSPTSSHEALSLGDDISILRQGRLAGTIDRRRAAREGRTTSCARRSSRIMFGEEARAVADVAELRDELTDVEPTSAGRA